MKIGKQIWFNGFLWDVIKVISPTKFDHYILVQRKRNDQIHYETKINPIEMALIDCGNNEFYPDSERVRKILGQLASDKNTRDKFENELENIWLDTVRDRNKK